MEKAYKVKKESETKVKQEWKGRYSLDGKRTGVWWNPYPCLYVIPLTISFTLKITVWQFFYFGVGVCNKITIRFSSIL